MHNKNQQAFTLIELSIVILIIGLIGGGVMVGKDIMRAYKLRMVISEVEYYKTSATIFQDKYDANAGDMSDAFEFWSTNCADTAAECNGDNNNRIDSAQEEMMHWRHLFLAEIVEKPYLGTLSGGNVISGINIPSSKLGSAAGHLIRYETLFNRSANFLIFGADESSSQHKGAVVTPSEAYNIDEKTDDGLVGSGATMAFNATGVSADPCLTSETLPTDYEYAKTDKLCILYFNFGN